MENLIKKLVESNQSAIAKNGKVLAAAKAVEFSLGEESEKAIWGHATISRSFKFWKVRFFYDKKTENVKVVYTSNSYAKLGNLQRFA